MLIPELRIREATADDAFALARVIIDATYSAFRGRVPDACLEWLSVQESATNWKRLIDSHDDDQPLSVAEIDGRDIVGLVLAGRAASEVVEDQEITRQYPVEISSLQVDPAWHSKGVGRLLVRHAAQHFSQRGYSAAMVRVLADNPNVSFYEGLGALKLAEQRYDWEGYITAEFVMGWSSIEQLIQETRLPEHSFFRWIDN